MCRVDLPSRSVSVPGEDSKRRRRGNLVRTEVYQPRARAVCLSADQIPGQHSRKQELPTRMLPWYHPVRDSIVAIHPWRIDMWLHELQVPVECAPGVDWRFAAGNAKLRGLARGSLLSILAGAFLLFCFAPGGLNAQTYQPNWASIDSRSTPAWFTDAKFGIFIHWGVYSVPAYAPVIPGKLAYAEWYWHADDRGPRQSQGQSRWRPAPGRITRRLYGADFPTRNSRRCSGPKLFDPDHWADVFAALGREVCGADLEASRGLCAVAQQGGLAQPGAGRGTRSRPGPHRDLLGDLTHARCARKGPADGLLLFALRVVQPALAERQAALREPST